MTAEGPRVRVVEPIPELEAVAIHAWRAVGAQVMESPIVIDSSEFVHDEAQWLDETELAEAKAALVEDGIVSEEEAAAMLANRAESGHVQLRAAIKYGWALAHLKQATANIDRTKVIWSVAGGAAATTEAELRYVTSEIQRSLGCVGAIDLCWPVTLEPVISLNPDRAELLLSAARTMAPIIAEIGILIPNATYKGDILLQLGGIFGNNAVLEASGVAAMEAYRLVSRSEPDFLRRLLHCAQEHFAFDKGRSELSTSEDDVHALPEVPDSELERMFIDDPRGRQLLYVTSRSILNEPSLKEEWTAVIVGRAAELQELVEARTREQMELIASCR